MKVSSAPTVSRRVAPRKGRTAADSARGRSPVRTSGRTQTETDIRRSETDLAESQRVAKFGSWSYDIADNRVRWSRELFRIFDVAQRRRGHPYTFFLRRVHPDDRPRVLKVNAAAIERGTPFDVEYRVVTRAGAQKIIREIGYARRDPTGRVVRLFGTAQDITDLRRAEQALREQQEVLTSLLNAPTEPIMLLNRKFVVLSANAAMLKSLGVRGDAFVGTPALEVLPPALRAPRRARLREALRTGRPVRFEDERSGRAFANLIYPVFGAAGEVTGLALYAQDITERKRQSFFDRALNVINANINSTLEVDAIMERGLATAAEAMGCETAAVSVREGGHWTVRYACGYPRRVVGRRMRDREEPHARLAVETRVPVAIDDAFNDPRVNRRHMRRWRVRSVLVVPLVAGGDAIGVIFFNYHRTAVAFEASHVDFATKLSAAMSQALTNSRLFESVQRELEGRKRAEAALQKARDELEGKVRDRTAKLRALTIQLNQAEEQERRRIASVLHDDLQQIVTGARFTLAQLRGRHLSHQRRHSVLTLTDDYLDKAQRGMRSLCMDLHPPVLHELGLAAALKWLRQDTRDRLALKVDLAIAEDSDPAGVSVRDFLFQAARELLLNVVKHAGVKSARVTLKTAPAGSVMLQVQDAGAGFAPGRVKPGGFGLFSLDERANFLGGSMEIRSAAGKGTCITLIVPRA